MFAKIKKEDYYENMYDIEDLTPQQKEWEQKIREDTSAKRALMNLKNFIFP
ncbi:MAG: hypothetical protein WC831_02740 [Parcubacteria group bacterium]|jgi:hypothetical protein